jgi:hypothetical protein
MLARISQRTRYYDAKVSSFARWKLTSGMQKRAPAYTRSRAYSPRWSLRTVQKTKLVVGETDVLVSS